MKTLFFIAFQMLSTIFIFGQKQTFDVVSFTAPKNWQQKQVEGAVQLIATDEKSGGYAIALINKAIGTNENSQENFNSDWNKFIKGSVQVNGDPAMLDPTNENGWEIISGTANYTDNNQNGLATLMTATGGNQTASVVLLTNTKQYQNELLEFINSLEIKAVPKNSNSIPNNQKNANGNSSNSVVGVWTYNLLETSGYMNNMPQYTAGYFRKEYTFKSDGTYFYSQKNWSAYSKVIIYGYEKGSWSVSGNKLTLSPKEGKIGEWKRPATNSELGSFIKYGDWKSEKTTYSFEIKYYSGSQSSALLLDPGKSTFRDGTLTSDGYSYALGTKTLIDSPPGFKH